jgi:hypothetical protein
VIGSLAIREIREGRMMRSLRFAILASTVALITGCYTAPVIPALGGAFTNTQAPLDVDYDETQLGSKTGKASTVAILGLFAWGNASTAAAARDGGITTIRHADYEFLNVLGLYQSFTTVVRGD